MNISALIYTLKLHCLNNIKKHKSIIDLLITSIKRIGQI